jgi:hypothetical protein
MPSFGIGSAEFPRLAPGEVADVVAFIRSLGKAAR